MLEAGFDVDPRQLLLAETEVYGLISGPSWLRQSLVADLEALGYVRNPYEKCIMTLPSTDPKEVLNQGSILIEVDDLLDGGNDLHRQNMTSFYSKYKCGKCKPMISLGDEGTLISGVRVIQYKDFSFAWHMNEYAQNNMSEINIPRGFLTSTTELDDRRISEVLTSNGQIGWIGSNGKPDVAAGHSIIAGGYKDKSPQLITDCNACVKQAQSHNYMMRVWSIPPRMLGLYVFAIRRLTLRESAINKDG